MFGVRAADELFEVRITFVLEFFVDADLRCVVAVNRRVLDGAEEFFGDCLRVALVLADGLQQLDLLLGAQVSVGFLELVVAHLVDGGEASRQVCLTASGESLITRSMYSLTRAALAPGDESSAGMMRSD